MDIYIPLHESCQSLANGNKNIQAVSQLPIDNATNKTFLILSGADDDKYGLTIGKGGGTVLGYETLFDADRIDRDDSPASDLQIYRVRGKEIAQSVHFSGAIEYLAAWLNEDRKQGNICYDIHAVLALGLFQKLPKWIKHDLFSIVESEAMKQVFASRYLIEEKREDFKIPVSLRQDIKNSSDGKTDTLLSDLMAETMQKPLRYYDSASLFDKAVQARIQLFKETING
jgi:hypothetical protein